MNVYTLLLLQISAHLLADFEFQPESWCHAKRRKAFTRTHVQHALMVFLLSWMFSLGAPGFTVMAAGIALCHLLIDMAKSEYETRYDAEGAHPLVFLIDQAAHLIILGLAVWFYVDTLPRSLPLPVELKTAAAITGFVFCGKSTNIIIKNLLRAYRIPMPRDDTPGREDSLENAGRLIGICERCITLALILGGQHAAVGLLITAKSILRFNVPRKNEYILIGTLLSFGTAIITGMVVGRL